jgi:hypothetical protein
VATRPKVKSALSQSSAAKDIFWSCLAKLLTWRSVDTWYAGGQR